MDIGANLEGDAPQTINVDIDVIADDIGDMINEVTVQSTSEKQLQHQLEEALPCTSTLSYERSHQRDKKKLGDIEAHLRSADSSQLKVLQAISDSLTSLTQGQAALLDLERQRMEKDEADRVQRREFEKEVLRLEGERLRRHSEIVSALKDLVSTQSQLVEGHGSVQVMVFPLEEV
ncbi:uncharacterized protein LOC124167100 [Ischnura elegans]|uniref:uncharacterized protein LOC124167100 n=1 Tax=Ischnura elegans TaxID=197161 RepID=UPI001ED87FB3|nr:uncharacterized protein LOC124167100 [Ischnura elegans]